MLVRQPLLFLNVDFQQFPAFMFFVFSHFPAHVLIEEDKKIRETQNVWKMPSYNCETAKNLKDGGEVTMAQQRQFFSG